MKAKLIFSGLLFSFLYSISFISSYSDAQGNSANQGVRIAFRGHSINTSTVEINYDIPFNGVVELRLFDKVGEKIWQAQYTNTFGENKIVLNRSKFLPGDRYEYVLNYKQDEVRHDLIVPPTGFIE